MNPIAAADALAEPVGTFGTRWMMSPASYAAAAERGHVGLDFYFRGRVGAMGEVHAESAIAVLAFFDHDVVREAWARGPAVESAFESARHFSDLCAEYGRTRLHDDVDLASLAGLLGRVVESADAAGLPLFAAWRALDVPDDAAGAVAHHLNGMRELRGGAHVAALAVQPVEPLHAVMVKGGEPNARLFGHQGDLPEVTDEIAARCAAAEAATSAAVAATLAILTDGERADLVRLTQAATERRR